MRLAKSVSRCDSPFENPVCRRGFSLVELLIVAALILIMFVMLHSRGSGSFQKSRKDECRLLMAEQFKALGNYAMDHDGRYPFVTNATTSDQALSLLVPTATTETRIFICPGSKDSALPEAAPFAGRRISYAYYMGLGTDVAATLPVTSDWQVGPGAKAVGDKVFSPDGKGTGSNHDKWGGNVLFTDGSVRFTPPVTKTALPLNSGTTLLNPVPDPKLP